MINSSKQGSKMESREMTTSFTVRGLGNARPAYETLQNAFPNTYCVRQPGGFYVFDASGNVDEVRGALTTAFPDRQFEKRGTGQNPIFEAIISPP
jgi:hypothetical protein